MFKGIAKLFTSENKDLRRRIYFTLFALAIYCLGTGVTITWAINSINAYYNSLGFLEIFNLMSGGGLKTFSIFALGVSPYITASIVTQLLQMDIIPYFKELKDQGYVGRQKINKITRYLGIILAFVQAYIITVFTLGISDTTIILKVSLVMTAGTAFLLWLGDQITSKGIGNGQSILIMAGILLSMPGIFSGAYSAFIGDGAFVMWLGMSLFAAFILIYLILLVGIIWITLAERRIQIQYSNRTNSAYGNVQSYLPIKINAAGVMPVIFASIIQTIPATIAGITGNEAVIKFMDSYIVSESPTGFVIYILLIFFFGYFYTFLSMNPENMSKDLNSRGGYIPGIRPGKDTSDYIGKVLKNTSFVGSLFLAILAGLPVALSAFTTLPTSVSIGGTGILIVVGVAVETYKQIESGLVSRKYTKRRRTR